MIFFKLVLTSLTLTVAIASQKAINSTSLSYTQGSSPTIIVEVPSSSGITDIASHTTINPLSSRTSSSILRGNISFTNHYASGYSHPVLIFSSHPSLFTSTGVISLSTSITPVATSSSNTQAALTILTESRGYNSSRTRSSQLGILAATSSSAVSVVTETNSAGAFTAWLPITTTITSPPPAYSTSLVSNTLWHSDTTTTSGATTFPVLYSCGALCGGDDHGLIIKGLGGDPTDPIRTGCGQGLFGMIFRSLFSCGTEFNFPPLIFSIRVDGTPEIVRDPEDPNSTNLPSTASLPSATNMTSTSMASTSTSMTSTNLSSTRPSNQSVPSSCASRTAFSCTTTYIYPTEASVSCLATSTCLAIATGCSLTNSPSSATPSSLLSQYVVYPIDGVSQRQINDFASLLNSKLGVGKVTQVPLDENESVFVALMNLSTVADLKSNSIVSITCINSMNQKNN
jgi:hypothetical protein